MIYLTSAEIRPPEPEFTRDAVIPATGQTRYTRHHGRSGSLTLNFELTPDFNMGELDELRRRLQGIPCDPVVAEFLRVD